MDRMTIYYHFPSLDTMLGLVFAKEYFSQYPNYTFNYYQVNHRIAFNKVLQESNTIYFIGILPSDTVLRVSLTLAQHVIVIDNKVEDMRRLQAKMSENKTEDEKRAQRQKLRFVYPANEEPTTVFQLCKQFFQQTVPQHVALLASYVLDIELNQFQLPNSNQMACGLYAL